MQPSQLVELLRGTVSADRDQTEETSMKLKLAPVVVLHGVGLRQVPRVELSRFRRCRRRRRRVRVDDGDPLNFCDSVEDSLEEFVGHSRTQRRHEDEGPTVIGRNLQLKFISSHFPRKHAFTIKLL